MVAEHELRKGRDQAGQACDDTTNVCVPPQTHRTGWRPGYAAARACRVRQVSDSPDGVPRCGGRDGRSPPGTIGVQSDCLTVQIAERERRAISGVELVFVEEK
jgi:hypothetical protein